MKQFSTYTLTIALSLAWAGLAWSQTILPEPPGLIGEAIVSEAWVEDSDPDKAVHAIGGIEIDAPIPVLWDIMMDCEMAVALAKDIKTCEILETASDGSWDVRKQKVSVSAVLPKFVTVFRSDYEKHSQIRISRVRGDLKFQDGLWVLEPLSETRTRVTYQARLKPKGPVPGGLFRRAVDKDLPEILGNLRDEAENRFQAQRHMSER